MTAERLLRALDQPRRLIWLAFAAIVTVAWSVLLGADSNPMASDLWHEICGSAQAASGHHVALWTAMVFAMMLPSAAPMVSTYMDIADAARHKAIAVAHPAVLASGYLAVWLSFAVPAGLLQAQVDLSRVAGLSGLLLMLAGLWQFAPLKHACLTRCRQPMPYFLAHWSDKPRDVFRMGLSQGVDCLGCCVALMLLMFAAGAMNLLWMAALALVMILEKTIERPQKLVHAVGAVLLLLGAGQLVHEFIV